MSKPPHARVEVLKGARGCGAKHVSKSKCKKHRIVRTLLDVERLKNCTPSRREAHFEVKVVKTHSVRTTHVEASFFVAGAKGFAPYQNGATCVGFVAFAKRIASVGCSKRICKYAFRLAGTVYKRHLSQTCSEVTALIS